MKTFLGVVALSVGAGLAVRYGLHRHDNKESPPPPPVAIREAPQDRLDSLPAPAPPPAHVEPDPTPPPPPAPRIAGGKQISDATVRGFATGPGVIYYCDGTSVMAQPKSGGAPQIVGECDNGVFDFVADAQGVVYCSNKQVVRITAGTQGSHVVADADCIMGAIDTKYAYYSIPGFDDNPLAAVYRVARAGGTPEKIHVTSVKEQYILAIDDDALWIGGFGFGTITKLAKTPNAKPQVVVSNQKGIVSLATTPTHLYWYVQSANEVRRRKKSGGPVEVVGHDVVQEPVLSVDGHVYWFEGAGDTDKHLVHVAPGAAKPETIVSDLKIPSLRVDSEGIYLTELDRPGVFMIPR